MYILSNPTHHTGLSGAEVFGIVFSILIVVIGSAVALMVGIVCYKKGVCKPGPQSSSPNNRHLSPTITASTAATRRTNLGLRSHNVPNRTNFGLSSHSAPNTSQTMSYSFGLSRTQQPPVAEVSPHLEAATHAGEAPPAYHTVAQYPSMTSEAYKNVTLSTRDSHPPVDPPAYTDITGQLGVHEEIQQANPADSNTVPSFHDSETSV